MKKFFLSILTITVAALFCMSGCTAPTSEAGTPAHKETATHNLVITPSEESTTIKLFAASQQVAGTKETVQTLTAVVEPTYATDQRVDWSFYWKNGASAWANEKDLDDYIKTTVAEDGAATVTIECLQPFGEPIIANVITRDSRDKDEYISAQAQIDYVKRIESCELAINDYVIGSDVENYMITSRTEYDWVARIGLIQENYGIGTIQDEFEYKYFIQYHEDTYSDIVNAILNAIDSPLIGSQEIIYSRQEIDDAMLNYFGGLDRTFGFCPYVCPCTEIELYSEFFELYRAEILAAYRTKVGQVIATITIEATGTYSSYTREIGIGYAEDALVVDTESVSTSGSVVF